MGVYSVVTCVVNPGKQKEFITLMEKHITYSEKFEEVKAVKVFNQMFCSGVYVIIWEHLSFEDFQKVNKRLWEENEGKNIWQEIILLTEYSIFNVWNATDITSIWEMNR